MKRYDYVQELAFNEIENYCHTSQKKLAYSHLCGVATLAIAYARLFDIDSEIAGTMGILHDLSQFRYNSSFDHASRSAQLANGLLMQTRQFQIEEVMLITNAIRNHSNKNRIDDKYSEYLKLCDVLYSYLCEPDRTLSPDSQHYIDIAKDHQMI